MLAIHVLSPSDATAASTILPADPDLSSLLGDVSPSVTSLMLLLNHPRRRPSGRRLRHQGCPPGLNSCKMGIYSNPFSN